MKPRIYDPTEKDFSHNGLGIMIDTTRCDVTEEANGKYEVEIEHPLISRFAKYFENGYQIKAKPNDQEDYHIFEIKNTYEDTISNTILIYGQSRTYKIGNREVQHVAIDSKNGAEAMAAIENGMDEPSDVKLYSDIQTTSSTVFEARNVLSCIAGEQGSMLQYWGGEIKREPFKLSLLRRRGRDNVGTVRYGKDLVGLKVKFDWSSIVTKVLPYADLQNSEDGTTNRIYGNAVLSDLATNYPDVYAKHIQFTEEQGVKDLASLNRVAANYFKSINVGSDKPKISIELEIENLTDSEEAKEFAKIRNYGLFDTFSVYHKLYDIYIDTKINSVVYDSLTEKNKKIYSGDAQMAFYTKQSYELQETIKTLTKKGYMSEFVDYVTNLINGVEGGSVLQYPKNKPHTTYYMDTDSRDTAKDVIAINNQGLGFSRTGWLGPFVNAWSIDGTLNADFIRAGKIRTDIMEVSFNGMGDLLRMVSGTLQLWNGDLKIMELTKKGLQFWSGDKSLGTIGTAGEPFPDLMDQDGPVSMDGKALMIRGDVDNDYIALSAKTGTGLILGNGKGIYLIDPDIRIIGNITLSGDMDIRGELKINGQKVIPGQNGGPGPGEGGTLSDVFVRVLALTAKYEMGDRGSGYYHPPLDDGAGWNYGKYSFTQVYEMDNFLAWLAQYYPDARAALTGSVGSTEFNNSWAAYGQANDTQFTRIQAEYFCRTKLKPAIEALEASTGVNMNDGQKLLGTLSLMASIQNWYPAAVSNGFFKSFVQQYASNWSDAGFITSVCDYIVANAASMVAPAYVEGIQNRFRNEKADALQLIDKTYIPFDGVTSNRGLEHLEDLLGQRVGNGQCYGLSAEYSGYMGGCGLGAGTKYGMSHLTGQGSTSAASDIGIAYDWAAVGWTVIKNPTYAQLQVGAIINITRGALWANWPTVDDTYGHTGVIRGLENGRIQTYEQNTEQGMIIGKFDRQYTSPAGISSIVIPPN
ncbi:phage minor structural protein, N-terminal region domain protein [Enterococcus casseliflavus]|uniref:phage tail spike protein n=2 Tax=Enterococcus casseliflavus TaxID=37734 RepID=UPI000763EF3A|nr:phage tail spike protein [Enterococcus casseliflavus]STQ30920.1 phage minor structural protein, N-terminal region domain protein [Enterococcus casseliflavus]